MPTRSFLLAALLLLSAPLAAQDVQELPLEANPPLLGDLLIHAGSFAAERSAVPYDRCPEGPEGRRQQVAQVFFDPPYREVPQVVVSLNWLSFPESDDEPGRGLRVGAYAQDVTRESMTIVVQTWCNSWMNSARGTYLAMGAAAEGASVDDSSLGEPPIVPPVPVERPPAEPVDDAARPDPVEPSQALEEPATALPEEW